MPQLRNNPEVFAIDAGIQGRPDGAPQRRMGNPFRNDVEKQLIAFIPNDRAYFIDNATYYKFIKPYGDKYVVYDNPAIWGARG